MIINNIRDLATHLGGCEPSQIGKWIFRSTECGCTFREFVEGELGGVTISGYAEGADAECESYQFNYPFGSEEFDTQLELCDLEGIEMWYDWNNLDWEDDVQDTIDDDNRQRSADVDAELNGGGW